MGSVSKGPDNKEPEGPDGKKEPDGKEPEGNAPDGKKEPDGKEPEGNAPDGKKGPEGKDWDKEPEVPGNPSKKPKLVTSYTPPESKEFSWEEAQARAVKCTSCKPKKSGPYVGQKGCRQCMGVHFELMRTRAPRKPIS